MECREAETVFYIKHFLIILNYITVLSGYFWWIVLVPMVVTAFTESLICNFMYIVFFIRILPEQALSVTERNWKWLSWRTLDPGVQAEYWSGVAVPFAWRDLPSLGLNPGHLHCRLILYQLSHRKPSGSGGPVLPRGSSWPRHQTGISCMQGGFNYQLISNWHISQNKLRGELSSSLNGNACISTGSNSNPCSFSISGQMSHVRQDSKMQMNNSNLENLC